jgi:hypothetical protein
MENKSKRKILTYLSVSVGILLLFLFEGVFFMDL